VDDKREGTGTAPDSVQRIIADLEAIDGRLASYRAAHPAPTSTLPIDKTRVLLRDAITALAPAVSSETGEEASSTKRRVKIKAESEIATQEEGADAKDASKSTGSAKSAARGKGGARNGRHPATTEKTPTVSLIARLGAATEITAPPQAPPPTQATPTAEISSPVAAEDSLKATADRLAQLEAEIADLAEAVTAAPTKTADDAAPPNEPAGETVVRLDPSSADDDPDDDAEITIVAANGAPRESATRAARHSPRVFRDEPLPEEEEAEVEIRGSDVAATVRGRPASTRGNTRPREGMAKNGALGKWRIFRGSN
jgi:hypothetical protein